VHYRLQALDYRRQIKKQIQESRMKRFHLHVSVENIDESVRFYSTLFAKEPTVRQSDYAKWMLEDPRINFAISARRQPVGINHLGLQLDSDEELRRMHAQLLAADSKLIQEDDQPCCYAKSDKYWVTDPTGIAWETFHTLSSIPVFGESTAVINHGESTVAKTRECCIPVKANEPCRDSTATANDPCCAT
jgi:hypothetical protein